MSWDQLKKRGNGGENRLAPGSTKSAEDASADSVFSMESLSINCTSLETFVKSLLQQFEDRFATDTTMSDEIKTNIKECFRNVRSACKLIPRLAAQDGLDKLYTSPEDLLLIADINSKLLWSDIKILYEMVAHSFSVISQTSKHDAVKHAIVLYKNIISKAHQPEELERVAKEVVREIPGFVLSSTGSVEDVQPAAKDIRALLTKL